MKPKPKPKKKKIMTLPQVRHPFLFRKCKHWDMSEVVKWYVMAGAIEHRSKASLTVVQGSRLKPMMHSSFGHL